MEDMAPDAYDPKDASRLMTETVAFIAGGMCREATAPSAATPAKAKRPRKTS